MTMSNDTTESPGTNHPENRPLRLCIPTTILILLAICALVILIRCKHIPIQLKWLYANLYIADGLSGAALILHLLIHNAPPSACTFSYVTFMASNSVYLLTVCTICIDRFISLLTVTPFLMKFRNMRIATVVICTWVFSFLCQGLLSLDGFKHYNQCDFITPSGPLGAIINVTFVLALLLLCILIAVGTIILHKKHLMFMKNAPISQRRHILEGYIKTATKEVPVCCFSVLLFVPITSRFLAFAIDNESYGAYWTYPVDITLVVPPLRVVCAFLLCSIRFAEMRYKIVRTFCVCSSGIVQRVESRLEIHNSAMKQVRNADDLPVTPNTAGQQEDHPVQGSRSTSGCFDARIRTSVNVVAPWDDPYFFEQHKQIFRTTIQLLSTPSFVNRRQNTSTP